MDFFQEWISWWFHPDAAQKIWVGYISLLFFVQKLQISFCFSLMTSSAVFASLPTSPHFAFSFSFGDHQNNQRNIFDDFLSIFLRNWPSLSLNEEYVRRFKVQRKPWPLLKTGEGGVFCNSRHNNWNNWSINEGFHCKLILTQPG